MIGVIFFVIKGCMLRDMIEIILDLVVIGGDSCDDIFVKEIIEFVEIEVDEVKDGKKGVMDLYWVENILVEDFFEFGEVI